MASLKRENWQLRKKGREGRPPPDPCIPEAQ